MKDENLNFNGDPAMKAKKCQEYLDCGHSKFYELIKQGLLPQGTLIGRNRVWRRSVLDAFLDGIGAKSAQRESTE